MQKLCKTMGAIAIALITVFAIIACSGSSNGRVINSADALKKYLDSQPVNSPDKPISVTMNVNDLMLKDIATVINSAGKFVNLDLSRSSGLTIIGEGAFMNNKALTGIVIPDSVSNIGREAFKGCTNLTSITGIEIDTSLNGTWVSEKNWAFKFNNGNWESGPFGETPAFKGIYFTIGGKITTLREQSEETRSYSINDNILIMPDVFGDVLYTKQ